MSSSTTRIQNSRSASRTRMDVTTGSGSRHGSAGAREYSREPRRNRTREASEHGASLRAEPTGPEEVNDWLHEQRADGKMLDPKVYTALHWLQSGIIE